MTDKTARPTRSSPTVQQTARPVPNGVQMPSGPWNEPPSGGPFTPRDGGLSYIKFAEQRGASYFDIGTDAWNTATQTERLAANQHVLDIAIKNNDTITLSVPFRDVEGST